MAKREKFGKNFPKQHGKSEEDEEVIADNITTNPMSPCTITLIDGNRRVLGRILYHLDSDKGTPLVFDKGIRDKFGVYKNWEEGGVPLCSKRKVFACTDSEVPPPESCLLPSCVCNEILVNQVPFAWAQNRQEIIAEGKHWLQSAKSVSRAEFSKDKLEIKVAKMEKMDDSGKEWKELWDEMGNKNPYFIKMKNLEHGSMEAQLRRGTTFDWGRLPLLAYESLVSELDGLSLVNLCRSSRKIEANIQTHFSLFDDRKREQLYKDYCLKDLDRSTVFKIVASFDVEIGPRELKDREDLNMLKWESVFTFYQNYWTTLTKGKCEKIRMKNLERKLRDTEAIREKCDESPTGTPTPPILFQRPLGGRVVLSVRFPLPTQRLNKLNLSIVEDYEKPFSKHSTYACRIAEVPSSFQLKFTHFPILKEGFESNDIPEPERVIMSLCNRCLTTSTLGGGYGSTQKVSLPEATVLDQNGLKMDPIFEVKENVIVIWYHPTHLGFYLLVPTDEAPDMFRGFKLVMLYRLTFPNMAAIWNKLAIYKSYYLPVITEFKGETIKLDEEGKKNVWKGGSEYLYHPTEPTYYGLSLVSPIYGVESFKPPSVDCVDNDSTIVESFEPQIFSNNGRKYLKAMRQPRCSGKGHGMFVFCSDRVIGISWDCITWLFGDLVFPPACSRSKCLKSVEVLQENGLMIVLNNCIVLMQVSVDTSRQQLGCLSSRNFDSEPTLTVIPLRVFNMDFDPAEMEISFAELNFDLGFPFIFIVVDRKAIKIRLKGLEEIGLEEVKKFPDVFKRMLFRIDF